MDRTGRVVIRPQFDWVGEFSQSLAVAYRAGKAGYIDMEGRYQIPASFDCGLAFVDGRAPVRVADRWGFIDTGGVAVVAAQYEDVSAYGKACAAAKLGGKWGYIDRIGEWVMPPRYDRIFKGEVFSSGQNRVLDWVQLGTRFSFVDRDRQFVSPLDFPYPSTFSEGLAIVRVDSNQQGVIDIDADWVLSPRRISMRGPFHDGLAPFSETDDGVMIGFIRPNGIIMARPQYNRASSFSEGLAAVDIRGKWGFIDTNGTLVIRARFFSVDDFTEGLALVQESSSAGHVVFGYIKTSGEYAIWPQFLRAFPFENGLALVYVDGVESDDHLSDVIFGGHWAYIDSAGKRIWEGEENTRFSFDRWTEFWSTGDRPRRRRY
jgi:hypothetical protein